MLLVVFLTILSIVIDEYIFYLIQFYYVFSRQFFALFSQRLQLGRERKIYKIQQTHGLFICSQLHSYIRRTPVAYYYYVLLKYCG